MPVLKNPKHERFSQELANGKSAAEAYVAAGYKPNAGNPSKLKSDERISHRISEILSERDRMHAGATEKAAERLSIDREWVLARLVENANRAMQAEPVKVGGEKTGEYKYDGSVANRALELLGKELGMFIDRKEQGAPGEFAGLDNPEQLREAIAQRLGVVGSGDAKAPVPRGKGSGGAKPRGIHPPSVARH
jgi:phage terminase small subunit